MVVTANEIKKRGVSIFDEMLNKFDELIISVRGKNSYVVIDMNRYEKLRALELDDAYMEVMEDVKNGNYHTDINRHFQEIEKAINNV